MKTHLLRNPLKLLLTAFTVIGLTAAPPLSATIFNSTKLSSLLQSFPTSSSANTKTAKEIPEGIPLILYGTVQDTTGKPLKAATVEIWQTDAKGYYDHPSESSTAKRDRRFQFFGTTKSDAQGHYYFRTLVPGKYPSRPRHIHLKVKNQGRTLLTSQFYFNSKVEKLANTSDVTQIKNAGRPLYPPVVRYQNTVFAKGDLIISAKRGGVRFPTPSQTEGPYYPVVDFTSYDNDLLTLE